jgi:two-component system, chemotaxis family, chemotaxis protein CheY
MKSGNILIVEDSKAIRESITSDLKSEGHIVTAKDDGSHAWTFLDENSKDGACVDLIISDWQMPVMSGLELLTRLRADQRFQKVPFIILTTLSEWKNVLKAVEFGATEFLLKPYKLDALKKKISPYL